MCLMHLERMPSLFLGASPSESCFGEPMQAKKRCKTGVISNAILHNGFDTASEGGRSVGLSACWSAALLVALGYQIINHYLGRPHCPGDGIKSITFPGEFEWPHNGWMGGL